MFYIVIPLVFCLRAQNYKNIFFLFHLLHEFPSIEHKFSKTSIYESIPDSIQWQFVFFFFFTRISKNKSRNRRFDEVNYQEFQFMEQFMDNLWQFVFFLLHEFPSIGHKLSRISSFTSCGASRWDAVVPMFHFYRTRIPMGCPVITSN